MKKLLFFAFLLMSAMAYSQSCNYYFNLPEGSKLVYHHFDKKDKLSSITDYKIMSIKKTGDAMLAEINTIVKDDKGEVISDGDISFTCQNGNMLIDMNNYLNQEMMEAYESMDVSIEGDKLGVPAGLKVGDKLDDGSISVKVSSAGMNIANMTVQIQNRIVETKEEVETPAGTFSCYKISSDINTKMMFEINTRTVEWYSPEVGMVKSETYDKKDKLSGKTVLQQVEK